MADYFLGEIRPFAFNFATRDFMPCNGQLLPISQYAALFSILGTQYGGNGTTNFALPNLQGSALVNQGQTQGGTNYVVGETAGTPDVSLIQSEMPAHNHVFNGATVGSVAKEVPVETNAPANGTSYLANLVGTTSVGNNIPGYAYYIDAAVNTALSPTAIGTAGSGQPHENMSPYLAINYCIAVQGVFPARN